MDENKQQPELFEQPVAENAIEDPSSTPMETIHEPVAVPLRPAPEPIPQPKRKKKKGFRFIHVLLIIFALILIAVAVVGYLFYRDYSGSGRSNETVVITLDETCSGTAQIAQRLQDNGLIDNTLFFRVYARLSDADAGVWQAGDFILSKDMGYEKIIKTLQSAPHKNNPQVEGISVTIPPQFTVEEIAARLEEKGICSADLFIQSLQNDDFAYDFARSVPFKKERVYRLEGYLFPDTYEFFPNTDPHEVVDRMLANLNSKLTEEVRQEIKARGWTIDEALTIASLIEGEAASKEDMEKVARVLFNRLEPNSGFSKLELCSTRDYVNGLKTSVEINAYNTYYRKGLPVGPINSPSLQALTAALNPSKDEYIMTCYYFATAYDTGITYFSQTFAQHQAVIDKYGIYDAG